MSIYIHPVFGGKPSKEQKESYSKFGNYADGKFVNKAPIKLSFGLSDSLSLMKDYILVDKDRNPSKQIPIPEVDWNTINSNEESITWFGHSTFLLSMDNKKLLIDPMFGFIASPLSFAGARRYSKDLLHLVDKMPLIDAVFITHDHYDHLDYPSIRKLKDKVGHFFVPHGVGAHLLRWGIKIDKITEMNWWDETDFKGLLVALTPSKHFSGRGLFNKNTTLWGGWVILGQHTRFYTSGDGGYDQHFKEIGDKYGPFDLALIEGGQYDRRWSWAHMTPENAVQANKDVHAKTMMLIHWGAFTLAFHGWAEPIERALLAVANEGIDLLIPRIGETVSIHQQTAVPITPWWKMY